MVSMLFKATRLSPGARVALFFAALFVAAAVNTAFLPLWFADRGIGPGAIGQILGAASLLRVITGPVWGTVADRIGRRRPVLLGAALVATLTSLLYLALRDVLPLLLLSVFQASASSALNPLVDSLALTLARERRLEYGPVRAVGSAAYMVATAATGWLLTRQGTWIVPWLLALAYGGCGAVATVLPETTTRPMAAHPFSGLRLLGHRPFRLIVLTSALIQGAHAAYYGFAPLFWRSQGFSDSTIGLLIAEGIIAEIALFAWGRRLVERLGPAGLTGCAAVAGAGFGAVAARGHIRDAASVSDAGAQPGDPAGASRHGAGIALGAGDGRADRGDDAGVGVGLRALGWGGVSDHGRAGWDGAAVGVAPTTRIGSISCGEHWRVSVRCALT